MKSEIKTSEGLLSLLIVVLRRTLINHLAEARKGQPTRLDGARPPTPRAALALYKSQVYQYAADAPTTLRAQAAARLAAALTTAEVRKLLREHGTDLAGALDRAISLVGFAGAMRRSELVTLDVAHLTWTISGMQLLIERSKTDPDGEAALVHLLRHDA